jgi:ABC-2 type transport system ATP-binding protein
VLAVESVIQVDDLRKSYGTTRAVDGVSFEVERGEIFGILGPNGAGKTTSVECLQGLRHPDSGTIRILGLDPAKDVREVKRRIGSQLQESALPDRIKVWEALDLFAAAVPGASDWSGLLEDWGLAEKRNATFASLSGGQKQRVLVALSLVNQPEIVFLDEMTTGMDPLARRVAWGLIERIRDRGATVILVTHFMDEAERLCDRIAVVSAGKVVALGTPEELRREHGGATQVRFTAKIGDGGFLKKIKGVQAVRIDGESVEVEGTGAVAVAVGAALAAKGLTPVDFEVARASLEDVYLLLTGDTGDGPDDSLGEEAS